MAFPDSPDQGHRRRILVFVVGSIIAVIALALVVYFKDEPLGDHRDLEPKPVTFENGDAAFQAWLAAVEKADGSVWERVGPGFSDSLDRKRPWDAAAVEKILSANRAAFEAALKADAHGGINMPLVQSIDESTPYFEGFQVLSKTLRVIAIERAHEGDFALARQAALVNLRMGDRLVEGNGSLNGFLVGVACQFIAYSAIETTIDGKAPDAVRAELAEALTGAPDSVKAYQHCMRAEFLCVRNAVTMLTESRDGFGSIGVVPPTILFNPNRTINFGADLIRRAISDAEKTPRGRAGPPSDMPPPGLARFGVNAFGHYVMAAHLSSNYWKILNAADDGTAFRRLLQTKIALLRYELAKRKLPATLAELVPEHLDAVPADPFDGNPIRYDAARGLVWVLGKDLMDGGCSHIPETGFSSKDDDPALIIHPAPPEEIDP